MRVEWKMLRGKGKGILRRCSDRSSRNSQKEDGNGKAEKMHDIHGPIGSVIIRTDKNVVNSEC